MRASVRALVALSAGLLTLTGPPAGAEGFTFHGSGKGHGIGLPQYGMLGLARKGWEPGQILRHFYRHTKVVRKKPAAKRIRVALVLDTGSVRLEAVGAAFDLLLANGDPIDTVAPGSRRTIEVTSDKRFRVLRPDGSPVGVTWGGPSNPVVARVRDGRIAVLEWGHQISHGEVRAEVAGAGTGHVVGVMTVEDYTLGVSEVPNGWPRGALQTQAIASRTYGYWRLAGDPRSGCACDVLAGVSDQTYVGWEKEASTGGARWVRAVRRTSRRVVTYKGKPIFSVYSSSSGGYTESIENVWPDAPPRPYLKAVCDPGDYVTDDPNRTWSVSFNADQLTDRLRPYTGDIGTVTGFADFDRGASGRVTFVRVEGTKGSKVVEGWDVRTGLVLNDTRFAVNEDLNVTGAIRAAYDRLGCKPGRAVTQEQSVQGGSWQGFVRGRMYRNADRGAVVWLHGSLLQAYLDHGGPDSDLGLPYRLEKVKGGQRAWFDGGTITCTPGCTVG